MSTRNPATVHPDRSAVQLNGTTPVVVAAGPATSAVGSDFQRKIVCLRFSNIDTGVVTIILNRQLKGGTAVQCDKITGLAIDGKWTPIRHDEGPMILRPGDQLTAVMSAPPTSVNPWAFAEIEDVRWQN